MLEGVCFYLFFLVFLIFILCLLIVSDSDSSTWNSCIMSCQSGICTRSRQPYGSTCFRFDCGANSQGTCNAQGSCECGGSSNFPPSTPAPTVNVGFPSLDTPTPATVGGPSVNPIPGCGYCPRVPDTCSYYLCDAGVCRLAKLSNGAACGLIGRCVCEWKCFWFCFNYLCRYSDSSLWNSCVNNCQNGFCTSNRLAYGATCFKFDCGASSQGSCNAAGSCQCGAVGNTLAPTPTVNVGFPSLGTTISYTIITEKPRPSSSSSHLTIASTGIIVILLAISSI